MNKKAYIQPATLLVAVTISNQLLAGSPGPNAGGETNDPDDLLTREVKHTSLWDDDEEE